MIIIKNHHITLKNREIKTLGTLIGTQQKKYKKKSEIMKDQEIYGKWTDFINDKQYKLYFKSSDDIQNDIKDNIKEEVELDDLIGKVSKVKRNK